MLDADVVVVGGGIAGASLATVLAGQGVEVVVLESTECFDDRVRGESMMPWGVREAESLGVAEVLRSAGAHTAPVWKRYGPPGYDVRDIPVGMLVPGVPGTLNIHHPVACQALLDAARLAGAHVVRGVSDLRVTTGDRPSVRYRAADHQHTLAPSLIVGADGRASVVRRDAQIRLQRQPAIGAVAGLLLDDVDGPDDHDVVAEHDHGLFLMVHQRGRRARAYNVVATEQRSRYVGPAGPEQFMRDATQGDGPWTQQLASAVPAGPCGTVAGTDTWTDAPFRHGVVLIGDAAGHNDPIAGCGLSIAMRDARSVGELITAGKRRAPDFAPYGVERMERMKRLRLVADVLNVASVETSTNRASRRCLFADAMAAMDPGIFPIVVGMFAGPESIPAHLVDDTVLDRIRAA